MNKILTIYTGGTIGMDYHNNDHSSYLEPKPLKNLLAKITDLTINKTEKINIINASWFDSSIDFISFGIPIDSSDISVAHWKNIGLIISENHHKYDSFVVLSGTDTLSYSATALSFMLSNHKAVIFTGSNFPVGFENSDADHNIKCAFQFAKNKLCHNNVWIAWQDYLIKGNNATKFGTLDKNFRSIRNLDAYLLNNSHENKRIKPAQIDFNNFKSQLDFSAENVELFYINPFINAESLEQKLTSNINNFIFLCYGGGNIPQSPEHKMLIKQALDQGKKIAITSQMPTGVINNNYSTSAKLMDDRIISLSSMTIEAALVKFKWALANVDPKNQVQFLETDQKGEISPQVDLLR